MQPGNNSFNTLSTLDVNGEEYSYFSLDPKSDFWDEVQQSKTLAIYIPDTFRSIELELMAVED